MLLNLLFTSPFEFILIFGGLIIAIGLHEAAHCYAADRLGDPTPGSMGRLTFNPIAHLDPIGTIAILVAGFGWGKSAPFDPYNLKNPRRDTALIALAGPATNMALALFLSLLLRLDFLPPQIGSLVYAVIAININLAIFNLLPIPPLDGSKIFLNNTSALLGRNSYFILLILMATGIVSAIISPITNAILHFLV